MDLLLTDLLWAPAEKGKLMQRLGLKKQGSKSLATSLSNPTPNPDNPYPMASGGHHEGRLGSRDQMHSPIQLSQPSYQAHPGSMDHSDEEAAVAAAVAASELAAQEPGRLSQHRSAGDEQEEQAMLEQAIKVLKPVSLPHCHHLLSTMHCNYALQPRLCTGKLSQQHVMAFVRC